MKLWPAQTLTGCLVSGSNAYRVPSERLIFRRIFKEQPVYALVLSVISLQHTWTEHSFRFFQIFASNFRRHIRKHTHTHIWTIDYSILLHCTLWCSSLLMKLNTFHSTDKLTSRVVKFFFFELYNTAKLFNCNKVMLSNWNHNTSII